MTLNVSRFYSCFFLTSLFTSSSLSSSFSHISFGLFRQIFARLNKSFLLFSIASFSFSHPPISSYLSVISPDHSFFSFSLTLFAAVSQLSLSFFSRTFFSFCLSPSILCFDSLSASTPLADERAECFLLLPSR